MRFDIYLKLGLYTEIDVQIKNDLTESTTGETV